MLEGIAIIVFIIVANVVWNMFIRGAKSVVGIPTGSMGPFEVRANFVSADATELNLDHIAVEARGLIPTNRKIDIGFICSVMDVTSDPSKPVLSMIETFQEPDTIAFQQVQGGGSLDPDSGFGDWARVAAIPVDALVVPASGPRTLGIIIRVVNTALEPNISLGFGVTDDPAVVVNGLAKVTHVFDGGYEDAAQSMVDGSALAVKMAIAVSFVDGALDESEGEAIAGWIRKLLTGMPEGRREEMRDACNAALVDSSQEAKAGTLSLSELTASMNALDDDSLKFQAIELCLDVMVADGVADETELDIIRRLAEAMEMDYGELMRMKDQRTVGLTGNLSSQASMEALLDIDPDWPKPKIQKHLRGEFRKWNGRMNSLTDAEERKNAQQRLDMIAEARKKYE